MDFKYFWANCVTWGSNFEWNNFLFCRVVGQVRLTFKPLTSFRHEKQPRKVRFWKSSLAAFSLKFWYFSLHCSFCKSWSNFIASHKNIRHIIPFLKTLKFIWFFLPGWVGLKNKLSDILFSKCQLLSLQLAEKINEKQKNIYNLNFCTPHDNLRYSCLKWIFLVINNWTGCRSPAGEMKAKQLPKQNIYFIKIWKQCIIVTIAVISFKKYSSIIFAVFEKKVTGHCKRWL